MSIYSGVVPRRRFWIVVACFAIANIAVWTVYHRAQQRQQYGQLRVEVFEPGDLSTAGPRPTMRWHFNMDVVPSAVYNRAPGSITPPTIAGHWSWDDPRTLCFTPDADLPQAQHIVFTLSDLFLRSRAGATLAGKYVTSLDSAPLAVQQVNQVACKPENRFVFEMKFSDVVNPSEVLQHLKAWTFAGKAVSCEAFGLAPDRVVRIQTDSIPQLNDDKTADISLILSAGLVGRSGPLGITSDYQGTVQFQRALTAMKLEAESPMRDEPYLNLHFNNEVNSEQIKQVLSIDPTLAFTVENQGEGVLKLAGDFQPGQRYVATITAPPKVADERDYPTPVHLSTFVPDRESGVWLDTRQGYLSSSGNRTLLAHAVNVDAVHLTITRLYDNNIVSWRNAQPRSTWLDTERFSKPIVDRKMKVKPSKNSVKDLRLSLDDLLPADVSDGIFRVTLSPLSDEVTQAGDSDTDSAMDDVPRDESPGSSAVVTLSDIGLTAKRTRDSAVVWATSLRTSKPLQGVRVRLFSSKSQPLGEAVTDADGLATVAHVDPAQDESAAIILADRAPALPLLSPYIAAAIPRTQPAYALTWLDLRGSAWDLGDNDTSGRSYLHKGYEAYLYPDRGVYRPGETVHLRAIVRGPDNALPKTSFPVRWLIRRPDLHDWRDQTVMLNADGAAAFDVSIPPEMPTGEWTALINLPGESQSADQSLGAVSFQVEEFIPNRMKASISFKGHKDDDTNWRFNAVDGELTSEIQADYLFGRPAAGLTTDLSTVVDRVPFTSPQWSGWTFGDTAAVNPEPASPSRSRKEKPKRETEEQMLDSAGHLEWPIDVAGAVNLGEDGSGADQGPWELTASAGVSETGGRTVTVTRKILVDALPAYIAARREGSALAAPGAPCSLQLASVQPDGSLLTSDSVLDAGLSRETWNTSLLCVHGQYHYESTRVLTSIAKSTVKLSAGKGTWSPVAPSSGTYIAVFRDAKTHAITSLEFDVTDGSPWDENVSRDRPEHLSIRVLSAGTIATTQPAEIAKSTDPQSFRVNDKVNVLIASPFAGTLLLTTETDDVVQTHVVNMRSTHMMVPLQLSQACRPNAFISATVIRAVDPNAKWQAHRAYGVTRVVIDPSDERLNIALVVPAEVRPLQSLDVGITVTDALGHPKANTPVTLAAVDEGICQLTNFSTPDPLSYFSANRALGVSTADLYDLLAPEVPRANDTSAVGGDETATMAAFTIRHITPVVARRVRPVALAWLEVRTDSNGRARTSFPLPQFEGRLRVMAVAYNASGLGSSDQPVTVRSPVLAQSTWPRFAAPGDRFTVPVVLFNNTAAGGMATVSATLQDDPATPKGLLLFGEKFQPFIELPGVYLPAHGQIQIDLPVAAGASAGVAHIQLQAKLNEELYEENLDLPVRPAAPMMQFGGYAVASTTQPAIVTVPQAVLPGTGSLAIHASAWPEVNLPQGLDYLDRYPYGCVEQTTSVCFPLLALGDIGKQIDPRRFDPDQIKTKIDAGIVDLIGMQTSDGGLAMWPGGTEDWPWGSIYAAHFLVEAKRAGYKVPAEFYKHVLQYVREQLSAGTDVPEELETQSYAAYVLVLAGQPPRAIIDRLAELATAKALPEEDADHAAMRSDARLFLACASQLSGRSDFANELMPESIPLPRVHRQSAGNIGSPIRDRALLIYTLATVQPKNPALPDLLQRLVDSGTQDHWDSTQDTAFSLLAIGQILHNLPHPKPFDSAQLLSGTNLLADVRGGRPLTMSLPDPAAGTPYALHIAGAPDACANLSWLETGVPLSPPADAQHGIAIHRRYLSLDGTELRSALSGQLVKVEITIEAPANRPNLVIEDMLPAGLEIENARLETTAKSDDAQSTDTTAAAAIPAFSIDQTDIRDDRVSFMGAMPDSGKATCEYLARAVTPGVFVIPPVRAEAMYDIATNGISGAGGTFTVSQERGTVASVHE
jgi:uncharacterized protein YfaS (alpha-2-macroglobulin family)